MVAIFVTAFYIVLTVLSCETDTISGLRTGSYYQPICSQSCGCSTERYGFSPVCLLDTRRTYMSPCHAGCTKAEDLNGVLLFNDCECSLGTMRAARGSCSLTSCMLPYNAYQIVFTVMLAVAAACFLMQGMAVLRAVRPVDKATAVGTSMAIVALLSFILGHLIYLFISHMTCVYSSNGGCLLHGSSIWIAGGTSTLLAALSAAGCFISSKMQPDMDEPTTEL